MLNLTHKHLTKSGNTSSPIFQITVRGKLSEDWKEWFNGMLISAESSSHQNPTTTLNCRVRDQAELIGIINWLHNMNLTIEKVSLIPAGKEIKDDQENIQLA